MARAVAKAQDQAFEEVKGFAERLAAAGFTPDQINIALKAALPLFNADIRLRLGLENAERQVRTLAQVMDCQ